MSKKSAGILLYRFHNGTLEVFLVHPGGPFWAKKDLGVWSIPKGEFTDEENAIDAAKREFNEETGQPVFGEMTKLAPVKQKSGKLVYAWAVKGDINAEEIKSNTFEMEFPPHSGKKQSFPEVDKAAWFTVAEAMQKINASQQKLIEELVNKLG